MHHLEGTWRYGSVTVTPFDSHDFGGMELVQVVFVIHQMMIWPLHINHNRSRNMRLSLAPPHTYVVKSMKFRALGQFKSLSQLPK